jgi:hypothetical protein
VITGIFYVVVGAIVILAMKNRLAKVRPVPDRSALDQALSIASLINGPVLGVFLVGTFLRRVSQPPALIGMLVSVAVMLYIFLATRIAWTWYVFIGSSFTVAAAWLASLAFAPAPASKRDELAPGGVAENSIT